MTRSEVKSKAASSWRTGRRHACIQFTMTPAPHMATINEAVDTHAKRGLAETRHAAKMALTPNRGGNTGPVNLPHVLHAPFHVSTYLHAQ